jgi:ferrous iron transport protein B
MENPNIVLLGNPNVGKTSLFNRLTKLNQKVGNYPGITVEKREGSLKANNKTYHIIDLPGTYTLFPNSLDEEIVFKVLSEKENKLAPNLTVVVAEPSTIKRGIILYQQARELGLPAIFVVNMIDEVDSKGVHIDFPRLEAYLKTKFIKRMPEQEKVWINLSLHWTKNHRFISVTSKSQRNILRHWMKLKNYFL